MRYSLRPENLLFSPDQVTQKKYVGQTCRTLAARWGEHVSASRKSTKHLYRSMRSHGVGAFKIEFLEEIPTIDAANEAEAWWISHFGSTERALGYNLAGGGHGSAGRPCSEETRRKISLAKTGKKQSSEVVEHRRAKLTGKTRTEEQRQRYREAFKNRAPASAETRLKMRAAKVGRTRFSDEQLAEMADRSANMESLRAIGRAMGTDHKTVAALMRNRR